MKQLKQFSEYFENKSKPFLIMLDIALLLCIGLVDHITGYEIGISLFYLIPISFAAWFGSRLRSIIISSLSVLTIAVADFMAGKEYHHLFIELWNLLIHFGFFVFYAIVLSLVKTNLYERKRLIEELQKTLSEVKQLSEILPICSYCKKIRDDEGYWEGVETYISKHTDTLFSHGMCPECAEKAMKEFEKVEKKSGH